MKRALWRQCFAASLGALMLALGTQGCGASEPYEKGASSPDTSEKKREASPEPLAPAQPGYPQPGMAPPSPPPPEATTSEPNRPPPSASLRDARGDFESARRELDVAASDCHAACRALGSMDRAAGHICDLASGAGDGQRCEEVKTALLRARDRVRTTCGSCPGGASVERSAPVPSVP